MSPSADGNATPIAALSRHGVFAALSQDALRRLVLASRVEDHAAGAVLMRQGEEGAEARLILGGTCTVEVAGDMGSATVATLGPGDLVGELAAFAQTQRSATVRAVGPARTLRLERATIFAALHDAPDLAISVIASLGARIEQTNRAIALLTRATAALAKGDYDPAMLQALNAEAAQLTHFARTFQRMADEMVEKRTLAQEMQTAAEIQRAFLPASVPQSPLSDRFDIAARMRPARNVGGDFYDYFMVGETRLGFAVGDVSGKGTPAAIFMSVARTVLKTLARAPGAGSVASVLGRVNATLAEDNAEGMFVTLAYGCLDLETGALDYASGGHEETFLRRASGVLQPLGPTGPACGLFEGAAFEGQSLALSPGDQVIFATDGITEAFNPARAVYGWARLEAILAQDHAPAAMIEALVADVARFVDGAPPSDDLTALVLRVRTH